MTGNGKTVFVTGGAGYIGSHSLVELLNVGYEVIVIDNFVNSVKGHGKAPSITRVETITGKTVKFYECDLLDGERLRKIMKLHQIDCVIHFAAIKAVGESMQYPLYYYKNNMIGTINLLEAMESVGCYQLVFSSSCTVYGDPEFLPITESHPSGNVTNVYGRTKFFIEEMLKDLSKSNEKWNIISLRYFNPVGAHPSGLIGEDPTKEFSNIMPYISQVALGNKPHVTIFGNDYDTPDGTGVRDFIHVMDLATGHVAALRKLLGEHVNYKCYNLGTGRACSVLELVRNFEKVTKCVVPVRFGDRREGDIVSMYANPKLAAAELGWEAKFELNAMCEDFWRWQTMNPKGYADECPSPLNHSENGDIPSTDFPKSQNGDHLHGTMNGCQHSKSTALEAASSAPGES